MQLTMARDLTGAPEPPPGRPGVVIRPIEESDLAAVGRLYWSCYPAGEVGDEAEAVADVRASWRGEYGAWLHEASLLAEVNGRLAAAILVVDRPPWDDVADLVFVIDLFTEPARRRRGLGEALVRTALAAVDRDRVVGLRVESENDAAVSLYRTLGFHERA
jgi:ribosomal protein S18 acetylase RimI-like enzyme